MSNQQGTWYLRQPVTTPEHRALGYSATVSVGTWLQCLEYDVARTKGWHVADGVCGGRVGRIRQLQAGSTMTEGSGSKLD